MLIEPSGERTLIATRGPQAWPASGPVLAPGFDPAPIAAFAPDLVVLRAAPGFDGSFVRADAIVVAHLPWRGAAWGGRVDAVVWSRADLPGWAGDRDRARAHLGAAAVWAVETRGAEGATAEGPGRAIIGVRPPAILPVDATGAGDAFLAGLGDALAAGAGMEAALAHACGWGAALASVDGSAPPGRVAGLEPFTPPITPVAP